MIVKPKNNKDHWLLVFMRLSVYMDAKKELDKKLKTIQGGNIRQIKKLYKRFDKLIASEAINLR